MPLASEQALNTPHALVACVHSHTTTHTYTRTSIEQAQGIPTGQGTIMQPPRPRRVSPMVRSNFTRSHTNSCVKLAGCCTRSHDVFASNQGHGRVLCDCHGQICFHPFAILSMLLECDHAPGRGLRLHNCTRTFTTAHSVSDSAQQFSSKTLT